MNTNRRIGLAVGAAMAVVLASVATMLPAGAANPDVTINVGNGNDVPITEVVLSTGTQTSSQGGVVDASDSEVTFSSITVDDGGTAVTLDEFNVGSITTSGYNFPAGLTGVRTWENGTETQVNSAGFQAAVERVLPSLDLRDFLAYDGLNLDSSTWNPDFDMAFDAPLRNSDYVLVAERDGNTFFDLVALDKEGNIIDGSNTVGFASSYRWNTGYAPLDQPSQPMWFTVVDIEAFGVNTTNEPIYGFRIDNDGEADVKFFGLSADPFLPAMNLEKTVYEGHNSGASCATSGELVTVANGADITFCFSITNNGEADLDNLTITDTDLGLASVDADDAGTFTVLSGDLPLVDGETMVIAYDATSAGPVINTATASADVILSTGGVNTVLSPETDTDTAQVIAPALGSISGTVVDNLAAPIPGVTITLSGTAAGSTTTNASGDYTFTGLAAGSYTVTETQPAKYDDGGEDAGTIGGTPTGDASVNDVISGIVLAAGDDSIDNDFDEVIRPGSISGTVVDNLGAPIPGVTITLSGTSAGTTTTNSSGDYTFTGLAPGTYAVAETQPAGFGDGADSVGTIDGVTVGDGSVNDVISAIVLGSGDDSIDNDFAEVVIVPGTISGKVVDQNNAPIAGVTIALSGTTTATTATATDGTYSFTGLAPGTYTVTETTPPGMADGGETAGSLGGTVTDDVIADIPLGAGEGSVGNDFDESVASLAGTVVDQDAVGIPGVSIVLTGTDPNGAVSKSTTTDANGNYRFGQLLAGTYTVTETTPTGYTDGGETAGSTGGTVTDDVIADITLPAGVDSVDNDFDENVIANPASISGTVVDDLGRPIPGVTVTLGGAVTATTVTDAQGRYTFAGLPPGTYTVTESQPLGYGDGVDVVGSAGGTLSNDRISAIVLVAGQNSLDNDFAETTASVAGTVVDQSGAGIPGVTVTLTGSNDAGQAVSLTTTTDASGDYAFTGLLSGTYTLTESQPAGYSDGADSAGSTGGTVTNDVISDIVLAAGVASVDNDFAEVRQVVTEPDLPDTGSETPLIVAYGLMFIVSGAILTLTASEVSRRRRNI